MGFIKAIPPLYLNIEMINNIKIVVPTLNTYSILPRLVDSLKSQTWSNWELIFVDGDSNKEHYEWLINLCQSDLRIKILKQDEKLSGIYGAMNQGFKTIKDNEWIVFWGSDDWAVSCDIFERIVNEINSYSEKFDLVVCKGIYVNNKSKKFSRLARFYNNKFPKILDKKNFRNKLFIGMTPPHQATLFSKRAFLKLSSFSDNLKLASDLDYFLKFSEIEKLSILVLQYDLVYMSTSGISSQKNKLEVPLIFLQ